MPNCDIIPSVISTNGLETVSPRSETAWGNPRTRKPSAAPESIWLDAPASIETPPPFNPSVFTTNGRAFFSPKNSKLAPCDSRASISPAIGRERMGSSQSNLYFPPLRSAARAVTNLAAVPALPTCSCAHEFGGCPPGDSISMLFSKRLRFTTYPRRARQSAIISVSRENSAPSMRVLPPARAARIIARFVRLFEPGGKTEDAHLNPKGFIAISVSIVFRACP